MGSTRAVSRLPVAVHVPTGSPCEIEGAGMLVEVPVGVVAGEADDRAGVDGVVALVPHAATKTMTATILPRRPYITRH